MDSVCGPSELQPRYMLILPFQAAPVVYRVIVFFALECPYTRFIVSLLRDCDTVSHD